MFLLTIAGAWRIWGTSTNEKRKSKEEAVAVMEEMLGPQTTLDCTKRYVQSHWRLVCITFPLIYSLRITCHHQGKSHVIQHFNFICSEQFLSSFSFGLSFLFWVQYKKQLFHQTLLHLGQFIKMTHNQHLARSGVRYYTW